MHINKIYIIIHYYSLTRFGCFCDHHQGGTQQNKQYTHKCTKCLTKPPSVTVYILSTHCGHKISNYVIIKDRQNFGVVRLFLSCIQLTHIFT